MIFRIFRPLLLILAACIATPALAATAIGEVAQVQASAWVDRDSGTRALAPGMAVHSGDRIRTGANARVYLDLADGSRVKLGEYARFTVTSPSTAPQRLLQGVFDLAEGAFRFTTGLVAGRNRQRDLSIRVGTATIGIRGTDVWGKASADRDLVALIEGRIELARGGQLVPIAPMQVMDVEKSAAASVKPLDRPTLARLSAQTDIAPGAGATAPKGSRGVWVALDAVGTQHEALALLDTLEAAGMAAQVRVSGGGDATRYALRLGPYASEDDARAMAIRAQVAARRNARIVK